MTNKKDEKSSQQMKCELHCHTKYSGDNSVSINNILKSSGIDAIAITDHNTFEGYSKAKKHRKDIMLIPGIEVNTDNGHVIALGIEELDFEKNGNAAEIIDKMHSSGGLVILPHPFRMTESAGKEIFRMVDAIEVLNGNTFPGDNKKAFDAAKKLRKPMTSGSDSHKANEIGSFACKINGNSIDTILKSIKKGKVILPDKQTTPFSILRRVVSRRLGIFR